MDETAVLEKRKEKFISLLKNNLNWIIYVLLGVIIYISTYIRTRNLPGLRDVTTNAWTLGPDLDPFLFLRWAKYIVEHGTLYVIDAMRYSPIGYQTRAELLLHPYMMAWFHKIASFFGSDSVEQSAALYPVFFFAITLIAFFLMTRKIFIKIMDVKYASILALISSLFLAVIPALLLRTIAGIPEKESAAFFFWFIAFFFFISAWNSEKLKIKITYSILAGAATAGMALIWGAYSFIFLTISATVFICFLLRKLEKHNIYVFAIWLVSSFILMMPFSLRYTLRNLFISPYTGVSFFMLFIILVDIAIHKTKIKNYFEGKFFSRIPGPLLSFILALLLFLLLFIPIFGFSNFMGYINTFIDNVIDPSRSSRLIQTVAENKQPFFTDWAESYGPLLNGKFPIFFFAFFIGAIYLFYSMLSSLDKKPKLIITSSFTYFLISLVFSRYSSDSALNGSTTTSMIFLISGALAFLISAGYYYIKYYKENASLFKSIEFNLIFVFSYILFSMVAARGAIRLIMILAPPFIIVFSCLLVSSYKEFSKATDKTFKLILAVLFGLLLISAIFSAYSFYKDSKITASYYAPSQYTRQWQKAMQWVRENTSEKAVFGHWWDYGYWVQSIGNRGTVLDGGNALSYWNYMMGRYALTGSDDKVAAEFLYAHNATHFLIDPTDIGKYAAFSKIGSDKKMDRLSWIPTFRKDAKNIREQKNSTTFFYSGGWGLDEDINYDLNGTKIFLPASKSFVGALLVERDSSSKILSVNAIFLVQKGASNEQYLIPIRYAYEKELTDFGFGLEAGIFMVPVGTQNSQGMLEIDKTGSLLYLSTRTVSSQVARHYLFNQDNQYFKLVHSESDELVKYLQTQDSSIGDFIQYQGLRGPIKIWQINYPSDVKLNQDYLRVHYPEELQ